MVLKMWIPAEQLLPHLGTHLKCKFSESITLCGPRNLPLRPSRQLWCKPKSEKHCIKASLHHFWFIFWQWNFCILAQVPHSASNRQQFGLTANWLAWWNLCKEFQNMENWALKCYDVGIGNKLCWIAEKYRILLLFPFCWIPFWPLGKDPMRQFWKYKPPHVNELFTLLIIC